MIRLLAFTLSVSLHLAILLFALYEPKSGGKKEVKAVPREEIVEVQLIQREQPVAPKSIPDGNGNGYTKVDEVVCSGKDEKYYGIGIIHGPGDGYITSVPEQYPAYKAGIRLLDRIVRIDPTDDRRDFFEITISRNGKERTFHIRKDYICYRKPEPKNE